MTAISRRKSMRFGAVASVILGLGMMTSACGDDGDKSCSHGATRVFTCASDGSGTQPQTCVDGHWYSTSFCANPDGSRHEDDRWGTADSCIDGATRAAVCGEGNKGLEPQECRSGA